VINDVGRTTVWQINSKLSTEFKGYRNKVIDEKEAIKASRKKIS
jgi:hypothetical protein